MTEALTGPVLQAERRKADADSERRLATERQAIEEAGAARVRAEYVDVIADLRRASDVKDAELLRAKGQRGADVLQSVIGPGGLVAGMVLWEAKRTKTWSDGWLPKLRENQRAAKADVAVIVSETLPPDVMSFDFIDGVWVSGYTTALPLAAALRQGLMETARARRAAAGADQTKDIAYTYLMGAEFRRRVTGLLEPVIEMRAGLDAEQRSMTRQWSQRGKQIERMALGVAGIYGDLQGILGPNLPQVEGLTLPDAGTNDRPDTPRLESGDAADAVGEVH